MVHGNKISSKNMLNFDWKYHLECHIWAKTVHSTILLSTEKILALIVHGLKKFGNLWLLCWESKFGVTFLCLSKNLFIVDEKIIYYAKQT